ncbi:membrane protein [Allgaiera indica]|uniref:Membrane protein n=1 Tax=Allgaiera indica TaxID=765699 RepID=A0AAN4UV29_9RHOB|nr:patatin-like phospholipase family protein [Allgaiera indica]GHE05103.1 membrane protein [Allgaiera indica]SDX66647.1 NTE family protein [Allgaiera indica]
MAGKDETEIPRRGEEQILVLQGGGALGAFQAGVFEGLSARGVIPDWIAGISIGAVNAALIAGNRPEHRLERLRAFWQLVTSGTGWAAPMLWPFGRKAINETYAGQAMLTGIPGFFRPQIPPAALRLPGTVEALGYYDTSPLRDTLLELVDFDYLNGEGPRLSVGAVNVETGSMTWFDSDRREIGPEHIMASGALPPGFPPVEIDGDLYWDGGLLSNTPLQYVLFEAATVADKCVWQVDLFKAQGQVPATVWDIEGRIQDIRYSSRTRLNTDLLRQLYEEAGKTYDAFQALPREMQEDPRVKALIDCRFQTRLSIVHLIYRQSKNESESKDYEFSRRSMLDHWASGVADVAETMDHPDWRGRLQKSGAVHTFDLTKSGRAESESRRRAREAHAARAALAPARRSRSTAK